MDRNAFVELMNGLWSGMGRAQMPDKTTLRVWYLCLADLSVAQFGRAIQRYLTERSSEFVNVQMIRELSGIQSATDAAPVAAWDEVLSEIKRVGAYQTPKFSDARTSATIKSLGGWVRLCDTETDELHRWSRQHFLKTFHAMPATVGARLTNLIEQDNAREGRVEAAAEIQRRISADQQLRIA